MSEPNPQETLALSLPRHVFRALELWAAVAELDLGTVVEAALEDYLAVIERCDPDVRALVRVLVPPPLERHERSRRRLGDKTVA